MLNKLWFGFFVVAFFSAIYQWLILGNFDVFNLIVESIFGMAKLSAEIAIGLIGILAFWCGVMKIAEQSGLANGLAKLLSPLFCRLMPEVPRGHPSLGYITMNMASNMMGIDNAATPIGLKAMQSLQSLNPSAHIASNAQILFLVLNTSSVTLFPVTIIMYRLQQGAVSPTEIFIPILLSTIASTLVGLIAVAFIQKINLFNRVILTYFVGGIGIVGGLLYWLHSLPPEQMASLSASLGNGLLFTAIVSILAVATFRKVPVYESFVEGAKEGFDIAIKIIPYMVAMLAAIGVLRASGILNQIVSFIAWIVSSFGIDTAFIEALPTAMMRPFSASGSRAMMLETMNTHGVDSFVAKLASVMQGSTETTFYVITVYFGAVGIKRVRHAIGCGLLADLAGIVAAIFVSYWFFQSI